MPNLKELSEKAPSNLKKDELVEVAGAMGFEVDPKEETRDDLYEIVKEELDENGFPFPDEESEEEEVITPTEEEEEPVEEEEKLYWGVNNQLIRSVDDIKLNGKKQKKVFLNSGEIKVVSSERFKELTHEELE